MNGVAAGPAIRTGVTFGPVRRPSGSRCWVYGPVPGSSGSHLEHGVHREAQVGGHRVEMAPEVFTLLDDGVA